MRLSKILAAGLAFAVLSTTAQAVFSAFIAVTPEVTKAMKAEVKISPDAADPNFLLVEISGISKRHAWLFTMDKRLAAPVALRDYLWADGSKKQELAKKYGIEAVKMVFENKNPSAIDPLPKIRVAKDKAARSYVYMDHPTEVADGGAYYFVDIPAFLDKK